MQPPFFFFFFTVFEKLIRTVRAIVQGPTIQIMMTLHPKIPDKMNCEGVSWRNTFIRWDHFLLDVASLFKKIKTFSSCSKRSESWLSFRFLCLINQSRICLVPRQSEGVHINLMSVFLFLSFNSSDCSYGCKSNPWYMMSLSGGSEAALLSVQLSTQLNSFPKFGPFFGRGGRLLEDMAPSAVCTMGTLGQEGETWNGHFVFRCSHAQRLEWLSLDTFLRLLHRIMQIDITAVTGTDTVIAITTITTTK